MEKTLYEQMGGTYTTQGDYYLPDLTIPPEEERPIGVWAQRHLRYLKQHHKILYYNLLTSGKLQSHLDDVEKEAQTLFLRLVKQYAERGCHRTAESGESNGVGAENEQHPQSGGRNRLCRLDFCVATEKVRKKLVKCDLPNHT